MQTIKYRATLICCMGLAVADLSNATIRLPALFSNGMVLEQRSRAAIWGWAEPGETVRITGSWSNHTVTVVADGSGQWKSSLLTGKAGGPYSMEVRGSNTIEIRDVWLGEVWLCSGQSNMNYPIANLGRWRKGVDNYEEEITQAHDSLIRMFTVAQTAAGTPQNEVKGSWQVCGPATVGNFSAVAYYFAMEIRKRTGFPVGIVHSSVGGTPIEKWMGKGVLYNGMIHPLVPYTIKGILWWR